MFSLKAPKNAAAAPATSTSRLDLHPVAHIADCLLDYQKQLSTSCSAIWTGLPVNLLPSNLTLPALSVLHSSVLTD